MANKNRRWPNRIVGHGEEKVDDIIFNPWNWRIHPKLQKESLRTAIHKIGYIRSVSINRTTGHLVDGHLRVLLADEEGQEEIPVEYLELTEKEEELALLEIDTIAAMAAEDKQLLTELLKKNQSDDLEVNHLLEQIAKDNLIVLQEYMPEPEAQIDKAEELQKKWGTALGQIWEIPSKTVKGKNHRLMCGDSTKAEDVAMLMQGDKFAIVFTDPPYGIDYDHAATGRAKKKFGKLQNDNLQGFTFIVFLEAFFRVISSYAERNASYYVCGANRTAHILIAAAESVGLHYAVPLVWVKQHFALQWDRYHPQHEWIFYGGEGSKPTGPTSRWFGPNNETTVWQIDRDDSQNYQHPTQKPVALAARAIRNSTSPIEIVLDGFVGSGSTFMAAEQLGRLCYGMEIEPKYVAVSLQRMADMGLEPRLANG